MDTRGLDKYLSCRRASESTTKVERRQTKVVLKVKNQIHRSNKSKTRRREDESLGLIATRSNLKEVESWRRLNSKPRLQLDSNHTNSTIKFAMQSICLTLVLISGLMISGCQAREFYPSQQPPHHPQLTFMPAQPAVKQHQALSSSTMAQQQQHQQAQQLQQESCRLGAPPQWRPYLDASSKAYLAPIVALATLKHFGLAPIQLGPSNRGQVTGKKQQVSKNHNQQAFSSSSLLFHAQSINNVGVLIEASFQVQNVLRHGKLAANLQPGRLINLHYKVSASLSTTSEIMALANGAENQTTTNGRLRPFSPSAQAERCALELTETELAKRVGKLFKVNRDYVLFLEQAPTATRKMLQAQRQQFQLQHQHYPQQLQVAAPNWAQQHEESWHPFAAHEPVSNQTSRSIHRVLCKNCVRAPTVQLVNATSVSISNQQQQQQADQPTRRRIKLDCRVAGNPTPWVEWFRNGKLLRNKKGRTRISTSSPWKGRPNERLSRLELELAANRNETGVYECRAMSVAAREPVVGTYTLLVRPAKFALIPMQQAGVANPAEGAQRQQQQQQQQPQATTTTATTSSSGTSSANEQQQSSSQEERQRQSSHKLAGQQSASNKTNKTEPTRENSLGATTLKPSGRLQVDWSSSSTTTTTAMPHHDQQQQSSTSATSPNATTTGGGGARPPVAATNVDSSLMTDSKRELEVGSSGAAEPYQQQTLKLLPGKSAASPVVVGQSCPEEAHKHFCLNGGRCVLIGHIEEFFCNCADGYHGHRCEYKSLGHQKTAH